MREGETKQHIEISLDIGKNDSNGKESTNKFNKKRKFGKR